MANIYTWTFPALQVLTEYGGEIDVVYIVHWRYNAVEDIGGGEVVVGEVGVGEIGPKETGGEEVGVDAVAVKRAELIARGSHAIAANLDVIETTEPLKAELFGLTEVTPYTSGGPFIPYGDLTQKIVQGWVEDGYGPEQVAKYQAELDQKIEFQRNPPVAILPPPWMITPTPTVTPTPSITPTITPTPSFTPSPTPTPVTPTPTPTEGYVPPIVTSSWPIPFWTPTPTPTQTLPASRVFV